jgi:hypothetical protein
MKKDSPTRFRQTDGGARENVINIFTPSLADQATTHYHFEHGLGKGLLRRALPDRVPPEVRWRNKRGFTPPLATWLRTTPRGYLENALQNFPESFRGILTANPAMELLYRQHQVVLDRSDQLFRWLVPSRRFRDVSSS